jgi:predicted RNase H-like nuclease (RuvC/YqgF family)
VKGGKVNEEEIDYTEYLQSVEEHNRNLQAEIERLKVEIVRLNARIQWLEVEAESWKGGHSIAALDRDLAKDQIKRLEEGLQRQDNKIIDLKALLTRAANLLEVNCCRTSVIDELRKAAE